MTIRINPISFKGTNTLLQPQTTNNNTSAKQKDNKVLITAALTTTAALAVGGLLVTKHLRNKEWQKIGASIIERPRIFDTEFLNKIVEDWGEQGFLDYGDRLYVLPKSALKSLSKQDKDFNKIIDGMKMSDNGFAVTVLKENQELDTNLIRYFDPECNTILKMVNAIRNDQLFFCEIN